MLHLGMLQGVESLAGRTLLLAHLGVFLIWQPVVRGGYRLATRDVLAMVAAIVVFLLTMSWGVLAIWLMVLAGVIGGGAFAEVTARGRLPYQLAVAYLVCSLFMLVLPRVVPVPVAERPLFDVLALTVLPALALVVMLLPAAREASRRPGAIDFLSAILLFLVLALSTLGGFAFMWLLHLPYLVALVTALFAMAMVLFVLAWAWHPSIGGPQLGMVFARRVLSTGLSFEEWLHELASVSVSAETPEALADQACRRMLRIPGVCGGHWRLAEGEGGFGEPASVARQLTQEGLTVTLYLRRAPSPALSWHFSLMVRMLAEFCREKRHARQLETLSYLRAIHETGARLTHDVKNLLQSLNTLCYTAARSEVDEAALRTLVARQLPVITRRLASTLEKLNHPEALPGELVPVVVWWQDISARHAASGVRFVAQGDFDGERVPLAVFNSVVDNLVQNALDKRLLAPGLAITVRLSGGAGQVALEVEDDGEALPVALARQVMRAPVASQSGLGMGLYQVARLADEAGYRLSLSCNRDGAVRFRLDQTAAA
ncbi:MAG: sensor histidine kinase [Proteobacteria bacterium]|nr:MAG: sensor histidine kinase [Pseudomonadota bacterium]